MHMYHYHKILYSHFYVHLFIWEVQHLYRCISIVKSLDLLEIFTTLKKNIAQNNEYALFCLAIHLLSIEETETYANVNYNTNPLK